MRVELVWLSREVVSWGLRVGVVRAGATAGVEELAVRAGATAEVEDLAAEAGSLEVLEKCQVKMGVVRGRVIPGRGVLVEVDVAVGLGWKV
jgi:hypothetical protein